MTNRFWPWNKPEKPDTAPDAPPPGLVKYIQAWQKLKEIPIQKLWPAVTSMSAIVFLAISGLIAWVVLFIAFIVNLFKLLTVKLWRLFK
jgi:hypothetical protein